MTIASARDLGPTWTWPANYIYCGRAMPRRGLKGSVLANQHKISKTMTREKSVETFEIEAHMHLRLERCSLPSAAFMRAIRDLHEDSVLICWCAPLRCHCEVIGDIWQSLQPTVEGESK